MDQPGWMAHAWRHLGTRERAGSRHEPDILEFFEDAGHGDVKRDEVPWCAAFTGACLARAGEVASGSLLARSYLDWGTSIDEPRPGAVTVLSRGEPWAGHVGFWIGETDGSVVLLGGNQSDAVTVTRFPKSRLLGFRWPGDEPEISAHEAPNALFANALAHVLEMEGGFTNDPDDPGGPTNKGIILEVFARNTGRMVNAGNRAQLIRELRQIDDGLVREIYQRRYWRPSRAGEMAPAIALMHFDASVNHGLTGAARLLQQALHKQTPSLDVDGEIGPLTMAAVRRADREKLLDDYASARRVKYRSLHHFWKFGRGWLNRVARTQSRARALLDQPDGFKPSQPNERGLDMTIPANPGLPTKWWGSSITIWGAVITALSTVVPVLAPAVGLDITPEVVREAGQQVVAVVQAVGGLVGTIMTIYGRARASQSLERRQVQLHL